MKLFFHTQSSRNCYVLGSDTVETPLLDDGGNTAAADGAAASTNGAAVNMRTAVVIDPGHIDQSVIDFIEDNAYMIKAVLITHDHANHVQGLRTFLRIYKAAVYAVNPSVLEYKTTMVRDGAVFTIGPFRIEVISVPGHAFDAVVYKIDRLLFTGDALSAGLVGKTSSPYGAKLQMRALYNKILTLPGDYVVLPDHGPPSSLEAERHFNAGIKLYEHSIIRKPVFRVDF